MFSALHMSCLLLNVNLLCDYWPLRSIRNNVITIQYSYMEGPGNATSK